MTLTDLRDLEAELRTVFHRHAEQAPLPNPIPPTIPYVSVGPRRPRTYGAPSPRRSAMKWAAVGLTAAAGIAATVVVVANLNERSPSTPFQPDGTEIPLIQVEPPIPPDLPVKPGSLVGLQVPGHPAVAKYITVGYLLGHVAQYQCTGSNGSSGCQPDWNWAAPHLGWTSTADNGDGAFNLYEWANVPANVTYVTWESPTGPLWQRAVAGYVGFPFVGSAGDGPLLAYDENGYVLDRIDMATYLDRMGDPPGGTFTDPSNPEYRAMSSDNLTPGQRGQLDQLAKDTVLGCLTIAGGTWNECVDEAAAAVDREFTALGGELVAPEPVEPGGTPLPPIDQSSDTTAP